VPEADELPAWKVQVSRDGVMWDAVCPILLSEHQRLSILAGSMQRGSKVLAEWPFHGDKGLVFQLGVEQTQKRFGGGHRCQ
jgi:hypothetical protein